MAFEFPWQAFLETMRQKQANRQQQYQDIEGIGKNIGDIGQTAKNTVLQGKLQSALQQPALNPPMQGPSLPGMSMAPQGAMPNAVQPGQQTPNPKANILPILAQLYPEKFAESQMTNPLQASEIARNYAQAQRYQGGAGKPVGTIYRNSATGELTDDPTVATGSGWHAYKTTQGDVLNKLTSQSQSKAKNEALLGRNQAWNRSIDNKQIDLLAKSVGLTSKQQSALQQNNLRADRAMQILSKPNITWQELALGEVDLAGIMQGGVPHIDEVKNTHFPGWQEKWADWKTYATGHPTENVPPDIRKKVLGLVKDVVKIDNRFINDNALFQKRMLGPTIRGGIKQFNPAIDQMTNTLTSQGGSSSDISSMSDDDLRRLAAGGQ